MYRDVHRVMVVTASTRYFTHVRSVTSSLDPESRPPEFGSGTKVVLIVDDIWIARRTAARYLTAAGYRVYEADNAPEALEVIRQLVGHVDLILTDVVMLNFNGVEFARAVIQQWPSIRILFMSAYSALVLEQYGLDLGFPFIEKPFTADGLIYKVAEILGARRESGSYSEPSGS